MLQVEKWKGKGIWQVELCMSGLKVETKNKKLAYPRAEAL